VVRIVSPVFYALGRNRAPVVVSMIAVLVNAVLNIALVRVVGYAGLALGTSIAALVNATTLLVLLHRHLGGLNEARLFGSLVRIAGAAAAMGAAAFVTDRYAVSYLPGGALLLQALRLAASIGVSLVVLGGAAWILRIQEFREAIALVRRRIGRRSA
jgi:putative peptidoglycan lipid II flippase